MKARNSLQFTRQITLLVGWLMEKSRGFKGLCHAAKFLRGAHHVVIEPRENHIRELDSGSRD